MNFEEIRNTFQELENNIADVRTLLRGYVNEETAFELILRHKDDVKGNRERLTILLESLMKDKEMLIRELRAIANTFNDKEEELFIKYVIENKDLKTVAKEMEIDYGYARHISSSIQKRFDFSKKEIV